MSSLARKFHEPHDIVVKDELEDLLKEYRNLKDIGIRDEMRARRK